MSEYYKEDLAFIHDVGHGEFALKSAPGILEVLGRAAPPGSLVVDLGCGSGLWARELTAAGYRVLGIDISEAMIAIARARVPEAEFRVESLFKADLPPCSAVTSISECLNYLFDPDSDNVRALARLFRRVYKALAPGGLFVFDLAGPGQAAAGAGGRTFSEGADWVVLVDRQEDLKRSTLTRRITSFRKLGEHYRRADEVHRQRLYEPAAVAGQLRRSGFRVRVSRSYGLYPLRKANAAFIARKPL
jgi:SAM-dependent methyltransferase